MSITTGKKKISFYLKYGNSSASTRERIFRFKSVFKKKYNIKYNILINDILFAKRFQKGSSENLKILIQVIKRIFFILFEKGNTVFIQHELIPHFPPILELILKLKGKKILIDIDDAFFFKIYSNNFLIKYYYLIKFKTVFTLANKIIVGNNFLKKEVKKLGGKNISVIPTLVEIPQIKKVNKYDKFTIIWIGSQSTSKYLVRLVSIFNEILNSNVQLIVIGPYRLEFENKNIKLVKWNINSYKKILSKSHVGIMPLDNTLWEKGKCGYKILQYYSHALPVIASPVGFNKEIVKKNITGYLPNYKKDWKKYILELKKNKTKANRMGINGYKYLRKNFNLKKWEKEYFKLIEKF